MNLSRKPISKITSLFRLSRSEARGVLVLLPLLAVAGILIHGLGRPKSDPAFLASADSVLFPVPETVNTAAGDPETPNGLFPFDPNTATLSELCSLGFELRVVASIVKYREAGKVFEVAEDLAMCYGVTLEQYLAVEPYIEIAEPYRRKNRSGTPQFTSMSETRERAKTVRADSTFDPNELDAPGFEALGFTPAQARTIINFRESTGGFTSAEQFGRCYAVSPEAMERLTPFIIIHEAGPDFPTDEPAVFEPVSTIALPVEINSADSAAFRTVSGIGEVLVGRIIDYRERLGGFARPEQLSEIKGMSPANYERIIRQITVDSSGISKIDINFAPHKELAHRLSNHPYATSRLAGKLLSARQLKGGWSNIQELVEDKILTEEQAGKLAPYLLFTPVNKE